MRMACSVKRIAYSVRRIAYSLLLLAAGCNLLLKPAEVELVGLSFPGESVVDLSVKLKNPNLLAAKVSRTEYSVRIGDVMVGRGRTPEVISLAGRDSIVVRFPLRYSPAALLSVLPQLPADTVVCRVTGSYRLEALLLRPTLQFSTERRVPVREKAAEALKRILGD